MNSIKPIGQCPASATTMAVISNPSATVPMNHQQHPSTRVSTADLSTADAVSSGDQRLDSDLDAPVVTANVLTGRDIHMRAGKVQRDWMIAACDTWITFENGEPIYTVFPINLNEMEASRVEIQALQDDPDLAQAFDRMAESREGFNTAFRTKDTAAVKHGWQRDYF